MKELWVLTCAMKWGCSSVCITLSTSTQNSVLLSEKQPQDDHSWSLTLKYASLLMEPMLSEPETLWHLHLCGAWFPHSWLQHSSSRELRLQGWFVIYQAQKHTVNSRRELLSPSFYGLCGDRRNWWRNCASYVYTSQLQVAALELHKHTMMEIPFLPLTFFLIDICKLLGSSYIRFREMSTLRVNAFICTRQMHIFRQSLVCPTKLPYPEGCLKTCHNNSEHILHLKGLAYM